MKLVFADAFFYFALLNPDDDKHAQARQFIGAFDGTIVTTAWVLTEVGDGLAQVVNRPLFLELMSEIRTDPDVVVVPPDAELFEQGLELYRRRPDKDWSLTDCISFVVMQRENITDALTGDHHFEQAGFRALLR